jgi:predicted NBD/HSP70 family sugar kinase
MSFVVKSSKATKSQLREHNRQLVLRSVYSGAATSRAALSLETGLTKPAISDLVNEWITEGLLTEEGWGESTDAGGKRPRLLRFIPDAREVIGVSINHNSIIGVLTDLSGQVIAEHSAELPTHDRGAAFTRLVEVCNGLIAQLSSPLLCLGVGISAIIGDDGWIDVAPRFGWEAYPLGGLLSEHYRVPVHLANSSQLAALAQVTFGDVKAVSNLVSVMISNSIGVGAVMDNAIYQRGSEVGHLRLCGETSLGDLLGWQSVKQRALALGQEHQSAYLTGDDLTYLHIRHAAGRGDRAAIQLCDELAETLAHLFAWTLALLRPQHVSLGGAIADLGEAFLQVAVDKTREHLLPALGGTTTFSVVDTPNLVAVGAAARALQAELGLV